MSPFVSLLSAIARVHDPTLIGSVALRKPHKDSVHIVVIAVLHWCLRAETHPCDNVVSAVIMFCLRFGRHGSLELDQLNSVDITWRVLIGTSCKLAAYIYTRSLALWTTFEYKLVDANGVCQECDCHLITTEKLQQQLQLKLQWQQQ